MNIAQIPTNNELRIHVAREEKGTPRRDEKAAT